jgi:hemolysin activation/secretion protein
MMPSLGQAVLRGFDTGRFHDRNLIAINLESRWAIFQHLDLAVFGDFGQVAPRFGDLNRSDLESSYGVGLRLHTGARTFFRLDAARPNGGGWRMVLKLYESLRSSKEQRWNTVVPVVR